MGQKDLTKGAVFPAMCLFALPMILGNLLQQCYNIVDTWAVGKYIGPGALAAVGSAFALMTFLTSALLGLCMGSGVVFSLCFGAQQHERLESSLCAAFALAAAAAALLTAIGSRDEKNRQAAIRAAGSGGDTPAERYLRDELAWRL